MATFSSYPAHNFYVAKSYSATPDALGESTFKNCGDGQVALFQVGQGGPIRSDLITVSTVRNVKVTKGSALKRGLRKSEIVVNPTYLSNGAINNTYLPVGTECLLRTIFFQFGAPSNEEQTVKFGSVSITSGLTSEQFYINLKNSLVANFSHDEIPLLTFSLKGVAASAVLADNAGITVTANEIGTAGNSIKFAIDSVSATTEGVDVSTSNGVTTITASLEAATKTIGDLKALISGDAEASALVTITGTDATACVVEAPAVSLASGSTTAIVVEEILQPFALGRKTSYPLNYSIEFNTSDIYHSSGPITIENVVWGTVTDVTSTSYAPIVNTIAEMEYFYHGERGDVYRGVGFPNIIDTAYMVDYAKFYNIIDMDFVHTDPGYGVHESLKHIAIACEESSETSYTVTNALIGALNTAAGSTVIASTLS